MATLDQLVAYIRQYKAKFPLETLKGQLLKQGVPAKDIEAAAKLVANAPSLDLDRDPFSDAMAKEKKDFTTGGMAVIDPRQPGESPAAPRQPAPTETSFNRPIASAEADFSEKPAPKPDNWGGTLMKFAFVAAVVIIAPKTLGLAKGGESLGTHLAWGAGLGAASGVVLDLLRRVLARRKS